MISHPDAVAELIFQAIAAANPDDNATVTDVAMSYGFYELGRAGGGSAVAGARGGGGRGGARHGDRGVP